MKRRSLVKHTACGAGLPDPEQVPARRGLRAALPAAALLAALLLLGGCAGLGIKTPSITVADISVLEASVFEQRLAIKLRILNPNKVEIPITGLTFDVDLNGEPFAKGVSNKSVTVPPLSEAVLEVTAVTGFAGIIRQIQGVARGSIDALSYRLKGRLITGSYNLDFDEHGRLEMPKPGPGQGR